MARVLGGQGSGNFGHAGRPGEVGGSGGGANRQLVTGSDLSLSGLDLRQVERKIAELDARGEADPDNHEYAALAHIGTALDAQLNSKLSERQFIHSAFVHQNGDIVAGGWAKIDPRSRIVAEIKNIGSVKPGAGRQVMDSLHAQLKEHGVKQAYLTSTARDFYEKLGYKKKGGSLIRMLGGAGSGNFGHAGRPGEIGGSQAGTRETGQKLTAEDHKYIDKWGGSWDSADDKAFQKLRDPKTADGQKMLAAFRKLPEESGVTYRGLGLLPKDIETLTSADGYDFQLHSSASLNLATALGAAEMNSGTATGNDARQVVMELRGRSRRIWDLAKSDDMRDQKEMIVTAGQRYRKVGVSEKVNPYTKDKYTHVVLEEVR